MFGFLNSKMDWLWDAEAGEETPGSLKSKSFGFLNSKMDGWLEAEGFLNSKMFGFWNSKMDWWLEAEAGEESTGLLKSKSDETLGLAKSKMAGSQANLAGFHGLNIEQLWKARRSDLRFMSSTFMAVGTAGSTSIASSDMLFGSSIGHN